MERYPVLQTSNGNGATGPIEQLYYTWSDVGIDLISAGLRIRAASEGLRDYRSARVQHLEHYLHYALPPGVGSSHIDPRQAPVSLALLWTGQERILVHKVYGKDMVNRHGSCFIHLIANLPPPPTFTARHAISLWRSSFWKTKDELPRNVKTLPYVSYEEIVSPKKTDKGRHSVFPSKMALEKVREGLPYLVQALLDGGPLKRGIFLAASDDEVATLISGLLHCLPDTFVNNLTFSTYEPDTRSLVANIVGTCWLSIEEAERNPHAQNLLPTLYNEHLASLNFYKDLPPQLNEQAPLARLARDASSYIVKHSFPEYQEFLDSANSEAQLDLNKSLILYEAIVVRGQNPSQEDVEFVLTCNSIEYKVKMLGRQAYQKKLLELASSVSDWWQTFAPSIDRLHQISLTLRSLADVLSDLTQRALDLIIDSVKAVLSSHTAPHPSPLQIRDAFKVTVDVMHHATPPGQDAAPWRTLAEKLAKIKQIHLFLWEYWETHAFLLVTWSRLIPPTPQALDRINPLLRILWSRFGDLLSLQLPFEWTARCTALLVESGTRPDLEDVQHLALHYHAPIESLLRQLLQSGKPFTVMELFSRLVESKYPHKMRLLFILLDSGMGQHAEIAEKLLQRAELTTDEKATFLKHYGPLYLFSALLSNTILEMFGELADNDAYRTTKMEILFLWIETPTLSALFSNPLRGETMVKTILDTAHLSQQESAEFFQRYAEWYIRLYPNSSKLLNLLEIYIKSEHMLSARIVHIWCSQPLQQHTLEKVLEAGHLSIDEEVTFLKSYGRNYIEQYPVSPVLLRFVEDFLRYLPSADIEIFQQTASPDIPSETEQLLLFLRNTLVKSISFLLISDWCIIANFVRRTRCSLKELPIIAESIGRLLKTLSVSQERQLAAKLLKNLALFCAQDHHQLLQNMHMIRRYFTSADQWQLLFFLASALRDNIQQEQFDNQVFLAYLRFAFEFRKAFINQQEQELFLLMFLNILLLYEDQTTLAWIAREIHQQSHEIQQLWQLYLSQRESLPPAPASSVYERFQLWRERTWALLRVHLALRRDSTTLARVASELMLVLNSCGQKLSPKSREKIDAAVSELNRQEEERWSQEEILTQPVLAHSPATPPLSSRFTSWWKRSIIFFQVGRALHSRRIGKIVRVATDHMITMERYKERVRSEWWIVIYAAFDFYNACGDSENGNDQAIVAANDHITNLLKRGFLAPRLTPHEKRRVKIAIHTLAVQNIEDTIANYSNWVPLSLLPPT